MAFCSKCGAQVPDGVGFCGSCGAKVGAGPQQGQQQNSQAGNNTFDQFKDKVTNTKDYTPQMNPADINANKAMGGLAYLIFFLPLIACPNSQYGRFHANQGLLLLILGALAGIVISILSAVLVAISWKLFWLVTVISTIIWLAFAVLGVIGLINGFSGKAKELPIIGGIRIIK